MAKAHGSRIKRPIRIEGDIGIVTLTKGYEAIIDAADAEMVGRHNWAVRVKKIGNYATTGNQCLHRLIMGNPVGLLVDHRDGDGLNCRRGNLREATTSQNQMNRRRRRDKRGVYKGTSFHREAWRAVIEIGGKQLRGPTHNEEVDAAMDYDALALHHFGEYAATNERLGLLPSWQDE